MHSVLVYHTISAPPRPLPGDIDIAREKFVRQLQWLSRWRRVARLEETLTAASGRLVALTFDDGYRDNLTVALPLLEEFGFPMTLFVTAGFVGREGYLSRSELREISKHPLITLGAHGLWHRHFPLLGAAEARRELVESRRLLESISGQNVDLMAWPYGDCNPEMEELSRECGYRAAWSVWKGTNTSHSLWRVPLSRRDNLVRFIAKVSGAYFPTKFVEQKLGSWRKGDTFGVRRHEHASAAAAPGTPHVGALAGRDLSQSSPAGFNLGEHGTMLPQTKAVTGHRTPKDS